MIRCSLVSLLLSLAALCAVTQPASAQVTFPSFTQFVDKPVQLKDGKIAVRYSGSVTELLRMIMEEAKMPYVMTLSSKGVSVQAQDLDLEEMLRLVCDAADPPLQFTRRNGVYLFTTAPPQAPPAPQVNITNQVPQSHLSPDASGMSAVSLERRLSILRGQRAQLLADGWLRTSAELVSNLSKIHKIEQEIALSHSRRQTAKAGSRVAPRTISAARRAER